MIRHSCDAVVSFLVLYRLYFVYVGVYVFIFVIFLVICVQVVSDKAFLFTVK